MFCTQYSLLYNVSKKSCPFLNSELLYENGQNFVCLQYIQRVLPKCCLNYIILSTCVNGDWRNVLSTVLRIEILLCLRNQLFPSVSGILVHSPLWIVYYFLPGTVFHSTNVLTDVNVHGMLWIILIYKQISIPQCFLYAINEASKSGTLEFLRGIFCLFVR